MSFEDESDSAVKRKWVAVAETTIKASSAFASDLADHEKLVAAKGSRLAATLTGEDGLYWKIAGAKFEDLPLRDELRFLFKAHWELQPDVTVEAPPVPELTIPEPEVGEPKPAIAEAPAVVQPYIKPAIEIGLDQPKPVRPGRLSALFKRGRR